MGLLELERDGLVERVVTRPAAQWWAPDRPPEMWRLTPIVYRMRKARAGKGEAIRRWWERALWRGWTFLRRRRVETEPLPPMPGLFAGVVTLVLHICQISRGDDTLWHIVRPLGRVPERRP